MKEYGIAIHKDLCFLLRQLTLSRISYQRLLMRDLMRDGNITADLEIDLDPYQALDLFIARPRCPEHNSSIFTFITSDWNLRFGNKIKAHLAKLEQANCKLFIFQAQKLYRVVESVYKTKLDLQQSFKMPDFVIDELSSDLELDESIDDEISKLTGKEVYRAHCKALVADLNSKLAKEDQDKLKELLSSLERLEELHTLQAVNQVKASTDQEIKKRFGSQFNLDIDIEYKYINSNCSISNMRNLGTNERSSFKVQVRLSERGDIT